jgi:hypothetical protein
MAGNKKIVIEYDIDGKPINVAIDATLNLKQAVRELTKEINKTKEGTAEFQVLSTKLGDVKDEMEKTKAKSRDLFGSLSLLPGPVGQFSSSVDNAVGTLKTFSSFSFKDLKFQLGETLNDFKDIAGNLSKATGITKIYTMLNNGLAASFVKVGVGEGAAAIGARAFAAALTATGVGALVVGLGFLISALVELVTGEKAAKEASDALNASLDKQKQVSEITAAAIARTNKERIAELKANGATEQQIRDEGLRQNREALARAQKDEEKARDDYKQFHAKANVEDKKRLAKELDDKKKATLDAASNLKVAEFDNQAEQLKEQKAADDKIAAQNKANHDKIVADNKTADEALLTLQRENASLAIKDERKRQDIELQNAKLAEEDKVKSLKISSEKKAEIIGQIETKYKAKQADVDAKRKEDDIKAEQEFNNKISEIKIAGMTDETEKAIAEREQKYQKDLSDLEKDKEFIKLAENKKKEVRDNLRIAADNDEQKIKDDKIAKQLQDEIAANESQLKLLTEGSKAYFDKKREIEEENYQAALLKAKNNAKELEKVQKDHEAALTDIAKQEQEARERLKQQHIDTLFNIAGNLQKIASKEKAFAKVGVRMEEALTINKIWMADSKAIRDAYVASPLTFGLPWSAFYAADLVTGVIVAHQNANNAIAQIDNAGSGASSGGGSSAPPKESYGKAYGDGGLIDGPRHAQGGTLINAEGGEAVMTRGAVTMFAPLLSALNMAGGGTSFAKAAMGGSNYDAPKVNTQPLEPQIIKTYVVENELTTAQSRQARLKNLSTL